MLNLRLSFKDLALRWQEFEICCRNNVQQQIAGGLKCISKIHLHILREILTYASLKCKGT